MKRENDSSNGRSATASNPTLYIEDMSCFGSESGQGNLLSIQPFMEAADYATAVAFYAKLDGYMAAAQAEQWLQSKTIVVFPEYIGTWLAVCGEDKAVFRCQTLGKAMQNVVWHNLPRFLTTLPKAKGKDKLSDTVLRMKATQMAQDYQDIFSRLARNYGVTIVAGSLVLPEPTIEDGVIVPGKGELQNVSFVFDPNGSLHSGIVRKIFLVHDEAAFTGAGSARDLPLFTTPSGRLAVLICADSWYPAAYAALAAFEPDIIVVPNNEVPAGNWHKPWGGYDPGPAPADVDANDVGQLTNGEAWLKYALAGRLPTTAKAGIHTFFRGQLWDLNGGGHTIIATPDQIIEAPHVQRAALVNYWL